MSTLPSIEYMKSSQRFHEYPAMNSGLAVGSLRAMAGISLNGVKIYLKTAQALWGVLPRLLNAAGSPLQFAASLRTAEQAGHEILVATDQNLSISRICKAAKSPSSFYSPQTGREFR